MSSIKTEQHHIQVNISEKLNLKLPNIPRGCNNEDRGSTLGVSGYKMLT